MISIQNPLTLLRTIKQPSKLSRQGSLYARTLSRMSPNNPRAFGTTAKEPPPLSLLPIATLIRSYFLTSILASPVMLRLCLPLMTRMANSQSIFLNPDRNPILHLLIRRLCFDHFTAGESEEEVQKTITGMKRLGFNGVILGYAKEVSLTGGPVMTVAERASDFDYDSACVEAWKDGIMRTLRLIGKQDFLAVKYSGAGKATLDALRKGNSPPRNMWTAMEEICEAAVKQGSRVWIDAEQQNLQSTIDEWTMRLMRKYNRGEKAVIYTTMQVYLKHMGENIGRQMRIAQEEGWILGIKLVRGAYIATEQRSLIHDTIQETHDAYDTIAERILRRQYPGVPSNKPYPRTEVFLATHNEESIKRACAVHQSVIAEGMPAVGLGFGQLQGMADEVGCSLIQLFQTSKGPETNPQALSPVVFKCLTWGTTQECLQFLLRRVRENADGLGRTKYWVNSFRQEILRRLRLALGARQSV